MPSRLGGWLVTGLAAVLAATGAAQGERRAGQGEQGERGERLEVLGERLPSERRAARRALCDDLSALVGRELGDKRVPAIFVGVLDVDPVTGEEWSWSSAQGVARPASASHGSEIAAVDTVVRAASIGKVVAATMAMVLVERGRLDLDAPVRRWLPDFMPREARAGAITVRHLLRHRSGLSRECPIGNWYDASSPDLAATVASLADTELLFAPGERVAYSNPGYAVLGRVLEQVSGRPFAQLADELVLLPLGLRDTTFATRSDLLARSARGRMWTLDGREIPTPEYPFGHGPATNLRSTVGDLVALARSWFPGSEQRVLSASAQAAMWRASGAGRGSGGGANGASGGAVGGVSSAAGVQDHGAVGGDGGGASGADGSEPIAPDGGGERGAGAVSSDDGSGIGLGFHVGELDGARRVGHSGTAPGTASELAALPDEGLAVAVVVTLDFANDVAEAIAVRALRGMRAVRAGEALPPLAFATPLGVDAARAVAGRYSAGDEWFDLRERNGDIVFDPCVGIASIQRDRDGGWIADDPCVIGARVLRPARGNRIHDGYSYFRRRPMRAPSPPPDDLLPLLGEYGHDHGGLIVYEDEGRLGVLLEWHVRELPERVAADHYEFLPGSFGGEALRFLRDDAGRVTAAVVANVTMPRRADPDPRGFRIRAQRAVAELRQLARRERPPVQPADLRAPDLVDLASLSPTLQFDIRYAQADNFLGEPVYEVAAPKLQRPAALALLAAHSRLAAHGYGLVVFDAYRPWSITKVFWEATPPSLRQFVADPAKGSRHNRGCAVDLSLYDLDTGRAVDMPSGYDEFTARAYPDWPGGTSLQRFHRELLRTTMESCGFAVYEHEWWHFDHCDWQSYPVLDQPLR